MMFQVRDLMSDVVPAAMSHRCEPRTGGPEPCLPPSCANNTAKAAEDEGESAGLPGLAMLREQLQQALRS
jgi:hypothetical protein